MARAICTLAALVAPWDLARQEEYGALAPSPSARAATQQHTATVDHSRPSFSSPSPRGHRAASMPALQPSMLAECGIVLAELGIGAEADYEPEALEPSMRETARQASRAEREQAAEQTLKARRRRPSFLPRELERLDIAWRLGTASTGHVRGSVAVSAQSSPSLTRRSMAMRRRSTVRQGLHTDEDSTTQAPRQWLPAAHPHPHTLSLLSHPHPHTLSPPSATPTLPLTSPLNPPTPHHPSPPFTTLHHPSPPLTTLHPAGGRAAARRAHAEGCCRRTAEQPPQAQQSP